jgi:hypothetical protein
MFLFGALPLFGEWHAVFPQFTSGGGWSSDIFITNQGANPVNNITLSFYGEDGSPLTVDTNLGAGSGFTFNLVAGGTQTVRVSSSGNLKVGYALLHAPDYTSLRGSEVFRYAPGGQVATEMGVAQQLPFIHYSFPVEVNTSQGINTGVALANPTFDSTVMSGQKVVVNLVRSNGTIQNMVVVNLSAGGHLAQFLNESGLFPGLDNFSGTVIVSASTMIGVVALRQDQNVYGTVAVNEGPLLAPFIQTTSPIAEVENNDTYGTAQLLSGPTVITGTIGRAGDLDYFKFTGHQGDIVSALVDTQSPPYYLDSVLRLEKSDGTIVSQNDQNGLLWQNDSFLQVVLPADGTYYLRVSDYYGDGGSNFAYRLHVNIPTGTVPPSLPQITLLNPSSGARGSAINFSIQGSNLSNTSSINFSPSDGISISNLQSTAGEVTALLTINAGADLGTRQISVTTPSGTSNTLPFTITDSGGGAPYAGNWSGTTSQSGKLISFTVTGGAITALYFEGHVEGSGCTSEISVNVTSTSRPITGNTFSFSATGAPGGTTYSITGTFNSSSTASGTLSFTPVAIPGLPGAVCVGTSTPTWNANKT